MAHTIPQIGLGRAVSSRAPQASWIAITRGVVAVIFGAVALFRPGIALAFLVALFGVYAFIDGVLALFASVRMAGQHNPWLALLFEGIVGIAAGIIAFRNPGLTAIALVYVVGAWAILTGSLAIVTAIEVRKLIRNEWALALSGAVSVLLGWLLFWEPNVGALALTWTIGIYAILFGVLMIYAGAKLRQVAHGDKTDLPA